MAVTPDLAGFREAQERLRGNFGEEVTFSTPEQETWPPGTPLDPETGRPYDPTVSPVSSGTTEETVTVEVIFKPLQGREAQTAVGDFGGSDAVLIVELADHLTVEGADTAVVRGMNYSVKEWKPHGIRGTDRMLAFLEETGR